MVDRNSREGEVVDLLARAADDIEDPTHDGLVSAVLLRVEATPTPERGPARRHGRTRPARIALAAVCLVIVATAVLVVSPTSRDAVASWFGLRGVRVEQRTGAPRAPIGAGLSLGDRVSLAEATRRAGFDVVLPPASRFGAPDEVRFARSPRGGRVSLLYRPRPGLPATAPSDVGMLLTEFRATVPDELVRKIVGSGTDVEQVTVDGSPGLWFTGEPHVVSFADEHGRFFTDVARLAGSTLIWERGPLTLRLESSLSKGEAVRIARSLVRSR